MCPQMEMGTRSRLKRSGSSHNDLRTSPFFFLRGLMLLVLGILGLAGRIETDNLLKTTSVTV
jgi:hypothetical protein